MRVLSVIQIDFENLSRPRAFVVCVHKTRQNCFSAMVPVNVGLSAVISFRDFLSSC